MNTVVISGRLARDIEIKTTKTGHKCTSFSVAVPKNNEEANFIDCVAWDETAIFIGNYFHKGSPIEIEGSIQTRTYPAADGRNIKITEVAIRRAYFSGPKEK